MNHEVCDPSIDLLDSVKTENQKIHIRIKQRNRKKSNTFIEGLSNDFDLAKILQQMKQTMHCNGAVQKVDNITAIQLFGDQRILAKKFLVDNSIVTEAEIVMHGY